jgi:hypothetical protein
LLAGGRAHLLPQLRCVAACAAAGHSLQGLCCLPRARAPGLTAAAGARAGIITPSRAPPCSSSSSRTTAAQQQHAKVGLGLG